MATSMTNPAGRPREFDVDEVLVRALDLFWRNGYRNTTTRVLEAELGVTQSSLYHAFGSKAQLLDKVLERYQAEIDKSLLRPLREAADGAAALVEFFAGLGTWTAADARGCLITNLMVEPDADPAIRGRVERHRDLWHSSIRDAISKIGRDVAPVTVRDRTGLLMAATMGISLAARAGTPAVELRRMINGVQQEIRSWAAV